MSIIVGQRNTRKPAANAKAHWKTMSPIVIVRHLCWLLLLTSSLGSWATASAPFAGAGEWGSIRTSDRRAQEESDDPADVVAKLIIAFNEHSAEAMSGLVTDDFQIYYVGEDGKAVLGLTGADALRKEMERYFEALPDVRTTSEASIVTGRFFAFRERVTWTQGDRERTQSSLAVYELKERKIHRVWYYPAQP